MRERAAGGELEKRAATCDGDSGADMVLSASGPCPTQFRAHSGLALGALGKLVRYVRLSHGKSGAAGSWGG